MHSYARNEDYDRTKTIILFILAILVMWGISNIFICLKITLPWWVESPSIFGIFGLLDLLFDNIVWKWRFLKNFKSIYVPDISGKWDAKIFSSFTKKEDTQAIITIKQTSSRISITLETESSKSVSQLAAIRYVGTDSDYELDYTYENAPKMTSPEQLHHHRGLVYVEISDDNRTMVGDYFSGRDRQNYGRVQMSRIL